MTHLLDSNSPRGTVPIGNAADNLSVFHPSKTYCGEPAKRAPTKTFFVALNYTCAGLVDRHPVETICPDCARLHEETKRAPTP